jgi:diguanylate cyclase (GGDEF)-like protein
METPPAIRGGSDFSLIGSVPTLGPVNLSVPRRVESPLEQGEGARTRILGAFGLLSVLFVVYLGWLILRPQFHHSTVLDGWLPDGFEVIVAVLCMARGLLRQQGRAVALALGIGLLSWAVGDTIWTAQTLGGAMPPSPSWADTFWLGFYPPAYLAVVLFMRREVRRIAESSWLDGAVAALGAASVCAAFAFQGLAQSAGGSALAKAVNLAYPIGDLLLFTLVVGGTTLLSGRITAPWMLLAAAMVLNAVGDTFNLFPLSLGSPRVDAVFHALAWPAAGLLMSIAMWLRPRPPDLLGSEKPAGFLLPGLAAVSAFVILFTGSLHHVSRAALALAAATLITVGLRLALSVRGLRTITQDRLRQSLTDELTGLRNRRYLVQVLEAFFGDQADRRKAKRRLAFLFIDLDNFKEINDSFGHSAGDELLKQLGPRLTAMLRGPEVLVRLGGDEFGIVLVDADTDDATAVAHRLMASIEEPFVLEGVSASVSASIGVATAPRDATDGTELLRCADIAMYRAKLGDSSFAIYDPDLDEGGNLWRLGEELRVAVEEGHFELHYQPQLELRSGEISAVEALLRWPHPRLGFVPPLKFLPLAEEAHLMPSLTTWVLDQALAQCASWRADGHVVSVSVNASPTNLLDAGFTDLVRNLLHHHGLPAEVLVLEVTETSVIANLEGTKRIIEELRDLGVVVSIDDFGAGFTSLAYLGDLAVGELKLDGIFITDLAAGNRERDLELVRATIEFGHAMGLRVVAECIEDKGTLDLLSDLGCDLGQGYFIGRPVPADRISFTSECSDTSVISLSG